MHEPEERVVDLINSGVLPIVVISKQTLRIPADAVENYRNGRAGMRPALRLVKQNSD